MKTKLLFTNKRVNSLAKKWKKCKKLAEEIEQIQKKTEEEIIDIVYPEMKAKSQEISEFINTCRLEGVDVVFQKRLNPKSDFTRENMKTLQDKLGKRFDEFFNTTISAELTEEASKDTALLSFLARKAKEFNGKEAFKIKETLQPTPELFDELILRNGEAFKGIIDTNKTQIVRLFCHNNETEEEDTHTIEINS